MFQLGGKMLSNPLENQSAHAIFATGALSL
jgi:hypothetical protein